MFAEQRPRYQPSGREPVTSVWMRIASSRCRRSSSRREILVLDPLQAVARDLPVRLLHGADGFRVARQRGRDAVDGERNVLAREQPPDAPEARARAVFVDQLHVHVALAGPRLRADDLRQERLRRRVAVQDVVLAALLVVEDELHGEPRAARPFRIGRIAAVADEVAGIGGGVGMGVIGLLRDVYGTAAAAMPPSDATGRLPSSRHAAQSNRGRIRSARSACRTR